MQKIVIPYKFCDSAGNEYFHKNVTFPLMTSSELTQLRADFIGNSFTADGACGSGTGIKIAKFHALYPDQTVLTDAGLWVKNNLSYYFDSLRCYTSGFDDLPLMKNTLTTLFSPKDVIDNIKDSITPTTSGSFTVWTFYLKNNNGVYGPFTYEEYTVDIERISNSDIAGFVFSGSGDSSAVNTHMLTRAHMGFFIKTSSGREFHTSYFWGYYSSTYGAEWNSFGITGVDGLLPLTADDTTTQISMFLNGASGTTYEDPLDEGGTADPTTPQPDFTDNSSAIDFPTDPTLSAAATGMVTLFSPSNAQLADLADYLWSSAFDLENFKKMFSDPMAALIGLSILPVSVPTSGSVALKFGGFQTTVNMNKANGQYVTVSCGSLTIKKRYTSALDYNPYTKISIYLPYIGSHELDVDEVMGKTITVQYKIDILSGACLASIKCGDAVLYQFAGSCASQIPVSNRDWSNVIGSVISVAGAGILAAATGGASAAAQTAAGVGLTINAANTVMQTKLNVQHTGSVGSTAGLMGQQIPYIIIKRPRQCLPTNYKKYEGYPGSITAVLNTLTGFTQIEKIHLESIPATSSELDELESVLKEGIII